ncbi:MAG: exonuclease [Sphingobacteriaceae bacterium]|nr:MAG: exonuclease [Sphingobacteriaceae bacterium]
MILQDFLCFDAKGLYCKYGDFYLDPTQPAKTAVISHAHADHAVAGNNEVFCTEPTAAFMELRYAKNAAKVFNMVPYGQSFNVNGVQISFFSAGHILGSAQVLMEYQGVKYLYTGDFKLQPDTTCEPLEWVRADVLITESTFAHPDTKHPDQVEEIKKLGDVKLNIMLGAYGLGKSQRLIRMITEHLPQKTILVHHRIMPLNAVYERFGYSPGKYQLYGRKLMKEQKEYVYIVPPFTFDSYSRATGVKRFFASGWKNLQVNQQDTLFISDHADWNDILEMVKQVQPREVWTLHGDGTLLKNHFNNTIVVKLLN